MFQGKKILITGGTGSLGQALTKRLLKMDVDTIRIFSRNENKQITMESEVKDPRLRFLVGDIRDLPRLQRALEDVDIVFHAAALKHVPVIEYNPFEAVKTNIIGSQNVIDACLHEDVEVAVAIGTDKAVSPHNTYGASKLLMEKLFVTASNYLDIKRHRTKFVVLRYGNVFASSGSVIPKFINQIKNKQKITITDPQMTRFSITMEKALDFILNSTENSKGSEIFVPKLKAYSISVLKESLKELLGDTGEEKIPIRQGEKCHETLISEHEIPHTWETDSRYVVFTKQQSDEEIKLSFPTLTKSGLTKPYTSDSVEKFSKEEMKQLITSSNLLD